MTGTGRPRVVAHRGASDEVAEHTLGAYRQALADGADGLECDVRLTRDGHLVCVHDRRLERTSTGRGVVSTKRLAELRDLDWASWKNPWGDLDDEAELLDAGLLSMLTLRDLLVMVRDLPRPVEVLVETKHPTRYSGWVERRLVELLEEFGWADAGTADAGTVDAGTVDAGTVDAGTVDAGTVDASRVHVLSCSQLSLRRMRRWAPAVQRTWVVYGDIPTRVRRGDLPRGFDAVAPECDLVRRHPDWVRRMHERGHGVYVWTVNAADDIAMCQELGVEAVITDRPRFAREILDAGAGR